MKMALNVLDGGYIRQKCQITVKKAEFLARDTDGTSSSSSNNNSNNNNGSASENNSEKDSVKTLEFNQFKQSRPKLSHAQVNVAKTAMKQALAWNEDDDMGVSKSKALKIVVLEGERSRVGL